MIIPNLQDLRDILQHIKTIAVVGLSPGVGRQRTEARGQKTE